jgi:YVTN family beta-propeller protein
LRKLLLIAVCVPLIVGGAWYYFHERGLPLYRPLYREYAYVTNGKSNSVAVIDLTADPVRGFTVVKTLQVGSDPTGVAANPKRNEIYVVNTSSANISVIDAEQNRVVATIGVGGRPYFVDVSPNGGRAWVANSGSNNVSVLDLDHHMVVATLRVGRSPGSRSQRIRRV